MDPFLGGLGPKNETQPGIIRNTLGSRFQPSVGRAAVQRSLQDEGMSDDDSPLPLRSDDSEG